MKPDTKNTYFDKSVTLNLKMYVPVVPTIEQAELRLNQLKYLLRQKCHPSPLEVSVSRLNQAQLRKYQLKII